MAIMIRVQNMINTLESSIPFTRLRPRIQFGGLIFNLQNDATSASVAQERGLWGKGNYMFHDNVINHSVSNVHRVNGGSF